MGKKKILIVDDEADIVETLRFNLETEGYDCIDAGDGQQALEKAKKENPDLILLDIMLPKVNGYKVSRLLKYEKQTASTPIIMITARAQPKDRELGEETGADGYVTKPFDMRMLLGLIKKFIGGKEGEQ